jgi:hypothetical protein
MKIVVQGTNRFDNYQIFLRSIETGLQDMPEEDREIIIYSVGPRRVHQMVREFVNISERILRSRGIKIKMIKMPPQWVEQNIFDIDYFIFLSKPKEPYTPLVEFAESKDIEVGVYRF